VTDRRPRQPKASSEEEAALRLAAIVNNSDDAIISKTLDGIITSWNRSAERMFGYTEAEAVGRHITLIIPPDRHPEEDDVLARLRRGETIDHYETLRVRKDGQPIHISLTVSPMRNAAGQLIGASKIARDITERRRAEEERALLLSREQEARNEAEKANRVKEEFLATLSHELRTPLNAMLGWTRMLLDARLDPEAAHRALETIDRNIVLLTRLVEDVLEISRMTMGTMRLDVRPTALITVIEAAVESIRPAARSKGIDLRMFLDPTVGPISADAARLQQVVWNLVSNAVKFTPRDGRVEVHLAQVGAEAELRVTDNGQGMPADFIPRAFDRFTQADSSRTRTHGGLGLGLAIVRHLVELHGGTVRAASPGAGQGSTFTVRLPLLPIQPHSSRTFFGPRERVLDGVAVLVVDDDAEAREMLTTVLGSAGARVSGAASVGEAFSALDRQRPAVILCDLAMPDEDGFESLRRVRSLELARGAEQPLPAIALTAFTQVERERLRAAGFTDRVDKPVDADKLIAAIRLALKDRQAAKTGTDHA
jgi:PAS domain S-box-containing protein